jgi:hypothetical protein
MAMANLPSSCTEIEMKKKIKISFSKATILSCLEFGNKLVIAIGFEMLEHISKSQQKKLPISQTFIIRQDL